MIKAVIFDLGYVIVHDIPNERIFQDIADATHCDIQVVDRIISGLIPDYQKGELTDETFWREFKQQANIERLPRNYGDLWTQRYVKETCIDSKMMQLIWKLRANGYKLGCLSNTIPPHVDANRERGLFKPFDFCIFSYKVGSRKPESEIFNKVIKDAKSKPEGIVYIDDIEEYVEAAKQTGMQGIRYSLSEPIDNLIERLRELRIKI